MATCRKCGRRVSIWEIRFPSGWCSTCRAGIPVVKLGFEALFLITIIVILFGRSSSYRVEQEVGVLLQEVDMLRRSADEQTDRLQDLDARIDALISGRAGGTGGLPEAGRDNVLSRSRSDRRLEISHRGH